MFTETQLEIIRYCSEECSRQHSGELSVADMVNAWEFADEYHYGDITFYGDITIEFIEFIERIGKLVEPIKNKKGFRTIPIYVGNRFEMVEKAPWDRVIPLLTMLLESYYDGSLVVGDTISHHLSKSAEDQFYYEYEQIHPFVDGNGRSGKILYNYLKNTLDVPVMPPNFWGSSNP